MLWDNQRMSWPLLEHPGPHSAEDRAQEAGHSGSPKLQLFTVEKQAGLVRGEQEVGGLELS